MGSRDGATTAASGSRRDTLSTVLIVAGGVLLFVAGFVTATTRGVLDPGQFATRVAASLGDERVARYTAARLTDAVVEQKPDLIPVRPLILATMTGIVGSAPFRGVVRTAARTTHRAMFEQAGRRIVLSLPDIGVLLRSALEQASPALAAKVPPRLEARLASGETERRLARLVGLLGLGDRVRWGALAAFWLSAALIVAGVAIARDRRRGLVRGGLTLLTVGLAFFAVPPAGRVAAALLFDDAALGGAVHGVWRAFYTNLRFGGVVIAATGLLLAAIGGAVLEVADPIRRARELLARVARPPARRGARLAWAAGLLAVGALTVIWPAQVAALVALLGGLALAYVGLRELSVLLGSVSVVAHAVDGARSGRRWPGRLAWVGGLIAAAGATWWFAHGPSAAPVHAGLPATCNGAAVLCDRPVNRVVFPGAHNAMSNADIADWMFPHHQHGLARQLQDGVRALALDIHYGIPTGGRVKTDLDSELASRDKLEEAVGPEGTAAAMRIRDLLVGGEDGKRGIYFCHGFCELGAYTVAPVLPEIRDFLVQQPGEVVILVIEDYVTVEDLDHLFTESGLVDFAYTGSATVWPTLRELIATNQRLIIFAESGRPGLAWLHPAFPTFQETPYTFHTPGEMSCRPNRGGTTGVLFQINNWIETTPAPRPSNAAIVNAYDALLARARGCQRERGHLPNVIAVDFYATGDVLRVARTLNGLDATDDGP